MQTTKQIGTLRSLFFTVVIALVLTFGISSIQGVSAIDTPATNLAVVDVQSPTDGLFTDLYQRVSPSVVAISVSSANGIGGGGGSGFVIDQQGHIVTNNHVVEGAGGIVVSFFDGTLARASIVGLDPDSDLAVIKVDLPAEKLTPIAFGNSDDLLVGETVLAIGSPFGQPWTLTSGIVSATNRTIQGPANFSIGGVIQTDAAINPGNSGGPLLNLNGEVVGVNTQMLSSTCSSSGVGFSVPSNLTQRVANTLIQDGSVEYSYIGISGGNVTIDLIEDLNLPNDFTGVVVGDVIERGPAAQGGLRNADTIIDNRGLRVGIETVDIITAIDGVALRGMEDLVTYLASNTSPGQTVTLTVVRENLETVEIPVTLAPRT